MHLPPFILELALLLAASAGIVLIFRQLRIPAILGLILTGVLIGPSGLALVSAGEDVQVFAEIGVVALLFTLGLEFSRERVRRVRRPFLVVGPLQLFGTAALVALLGWSLADLPPRVATFGGFLVALSSTAVVLRLYSQRRELEGPHGQVGLGVLLFQDLMLAPMLAVTPLLAGSTEGGLGAMVARFATSAVILLAVFLAVRWLAPPLLGRLIGARLPDIFLMGAVAVCLGMSALTAHLGFSAALGAFLAGVLLAEADYSHQVASEVGPFRDVFTNFFFVSVGMLLDLPAALAHLPAVLGLAAGVIVLKGLVTFLAALGAGRGVAAAAAAGLGLAQIGEFSFVLAGVGLTLGLLTGAEFQVILGASVVTLLLTPALVVLGPRLGRWLARRGGIHLEDEAEELTDHVVIAGYGLNGRQLGQVLTEARIPWIALDLDRARVQEAQRRGEPVHFGDATRGANLGHCGIERARVAVLTLSDPWALRQVLVTARQLNAGLFLLVRSTRLDGIDILDHLGANEVIASELETSIELVTRVLQRFHIPRNVIDAEIRILRADHYQMLRQPGPSGAVTRTLLAALERGTTEIFRVEPASPAAGSTLAQLDLRRTTGATVIAVVRDGAPRSNPPADLELLAGDDLVLVGGHAEIEAAFRRLSSGDSTTPPPDA